MCAHKNTFLKRGGGGNRHSVIMLVGMYVYICASLSS